MFRESIASQETALPCNQNSFDSEHNSTFRRFIIETILIVTLFYSPNLFSFSSVTGYIKHNNIDIHAQITDKGLEPFKFTNISFRNIMAGNVSHDFYPNLINKAEFHCDRNRGVSHREAAEKCKKAAYIFLKRAGDYIRAGKVFEGLHFFGKSLHIFQDFVSHSNLVDLNKKDRLLSLYFILNKSEKVPDALSFTGWDWKTEKGEAEGLLIGDFYPHDLKAKDQPHGNKECKKKLKSYKNKTKFEASFQEAVYITTEVTKMLNNDVLKSIRLTTSLR
jgi:hypothetical protein